MKKKLTKSLNNLKNNKPYIAIISVALIGSLLLLISNAASPYAKQEAENSTLTNGATKITDANASGGQAVLFNQATTPPPSTGRGPTGTHWPSHTPAYNTPATKFINNLSELNAALATANSGDVIEVKPSTYSSLLTITNGNPTWTKNVLVRPPLGQVLSVVMNAEIINNAPRVTIAGLKVNANLTIRDKADRSAYARILLASQSFISVRPDSGTGGILEDAGIYEVVVDEPKFGNDRMNINPGSSGKVVRFTLSGAWLKGAYRLVGSPDHSDTIQIVGITGGSIYDISIIDSYIFASSNAAMQVAELNGNAVFTNTWIADCGRNPVPVPEGYECGGTHGINAGGKITDTNVTWLLNSNEFNGNLRVATRHILNGNNNKLEKLVLYNQETGKDSLGTSANIIGTNNIISDTQSFSTPVLPNYTANWQK